MASLQPSEKSRTRNATTKRQIMQWKSDPHSHNMVTNLAILNINGIKSPTRMRMLHDFIRKHDILFLQEITHPSLDNLSGYTVHYNIHGRSEK